MRARYEFSRGRPQPVPASPPRVAHRPAAARAPRTHDAGVHLRPRLGPVNSLSAVVKDVGVRPPNDGRRGCSARGRHPAAAGACPRATGPDTRNRTSNPDSWVLPGRTAIGGSAHSPRARPRHHTGSRCCRRCRRRRRRHGTVGAIRIGGLEGPRDGGSAYQRASRAGCEGVIAKRNDIRRGHALGLRWM